MSKLTEALAIVVEPLMTLIKRKADRDEIPVVPPIPTKLSQLASDSEHRTVTDDDRWYWDSKSNFSGSYNDLTNKPTIPTAIVSYNSQTLTDGQKTQARINIGAGTSNFSGSYNDLTDAPIEVLKNVHGDQLFVNSDDIVEAFTLTSTGEKFYRVGTLSSGASPLTGYGAYVNVRFTPPGSTNTYSASINIDDYESHVSTGSPYYVCYYSEPFVNDVSFSSVSTVTYRLAFNATGEVFLSSDISVPNRNIYINSVHKIEQKVIKDEYIPDNLALKNDIPDSIVNPATATVGQTIAVKTVDENGKPTEWETVDVNVIASSTEGSVKKFRITVDDSGTLSATEVT